MKKIGSCFLLFLILTVLTGCWDRKEAEEYSFVTVIGLDMPKGIDIEKEQAVDVTFQFANPKLNVKGAPLSDKSEQKDIITLTAPDLVTAKNTVNSFVTRQILFSHTKALVVSEELARTEYFFRFLSSAIKEREVRREISLIVTEGRAEEFISKNKPELNVRSHRYYRFLIERSRETGLVPASTINRFFSITEADADLFLAMYGSVKGKKDEEFKDEDQYIAGQVPKKGGNPVQLMGSAVFKEGKMIGKLTGEETRISILLDNTQNIQDMYSSFADPLDKKYKIGVRIEKNEKTKVKVKLRKGRPPKIDVYYPVEIEILSIPSMVNYGDNLENQRLLKRTIASKMKKNAEKLIKKTQKEFKSDAFYWSLYVRPLFSTVKEYEEWDWTNKNYPYADINVTMDVQIIGFGKQLRESEMKKVTD